MRLACSTPLYGKIYFLCAVAGREMPYPFSDVDMSVTQQNNLAALL